MTITPTLTNTYRDRTGWFPEAWEDEPDHVEWRDETTGLPCLAHRNTLGAWCGYVGVHTDHPWHSKGYAECLNPDCGEEEWCHYECTPGGRIRIHGGLTYAAACQHGPEGESICHVPAAGEPDDVWWFGFDCAHYLDIVPGTAAGWLEGDETYRDLPYVQDQCTDLARQLAAER